jgi:hypothetical protein
MGFLKSLFGVTGPGRYMAAKNALVAKYTFNNLDESTKKSVDNEIVNVLITGGIPSSQAIKHKATLNEARYFGLTAFALGNLGIQPKLSGILFRNNWELVQNPLLSIPEEAMKMASDEIKRKHGIDVTINV